MYLLRLVTEKMHLLKLLTTQVLQAVSLIPSWKISFLSDIDWDTNREDVETDLTTDGILQFQVWEFFFQSINKGLADLVHLKVSREMGMEWIKTLS